MLGQSKIHQITALVPIKEESERLKNKNFKLFNGIPLYQIVLKTLQNCKNISSIIVNTDSTEIKTICPQLFSKVKILDRPQEIKGNDVTMNTLIDYDLNMVKGEHFIQTHVTNPLLTETTINNAINLYFSNQNELDSVISVTPVKKRVYDKNVKPINHNFKKLLQTQDLDEVLIENSNFFIFSRTSFYNNKKNRVGVTPIPYYMNEIESIDIDEEREFKLAELVLKNKNLFNLK